MIVTENPNTKNREFIYWSMWIESHTHTLTTAIVGTCKSRRGEILSTPTSSSSGLPTERKNSRSQICKGVISCLFPKVKILNVYVRQLVLIKQRTTCGSMAQKCKFTTTHRWPLISLLHYLNDKYSKHTYEFKPTLIARRFASTFVSTFPLYI